MKNKIASAAAMPPDSSTFPITSDVRQTQGSGAYRRRSRGRLTQMDDGAPAEAVPG
jgi:hypothetical protein